MVTAVRYWLGSLTCRMCTAKVGFQRTEHTGNKCHRPKWSASGQSLALCDSVVYYGVLQSETPTKQTGKAPAATPPRGRQGAKIPLRDAMAKAHWGDMMPSPRRVGSHSPEASNDGCMN